MRALLIFVGLLLLPLSAAAQTCVAREVPAFPVEPVTVKVMLHSGRTLTGRVVCADNDSFILADGGRIRHIQVSDVLRIVKPRDSILSGFLLGATIGAVFASAIAGGEAQYAPDPDTPGTAMLKGALAIGGIGAAIDALHGSSWTVYAAPNRGLRVTFRKRF